MVVERYVEEVLNRHDLGALERLVADETLRQRVRLLLQAFPDLEVTLNLVVGEGELVAVNLIGRGTHRGTFQGVPPTGRRWAATCSAFYRVEHGRIAEAWVNWDVLGILDQLGAAAMVAFDRRREDDAAVKNGGNDMPSKDWKAWINEMPGAERALHVTGSVEVDNSRFGARLEAEGPGADPAIRRLRYEIYEKSEIGTPALTYVKVDPYSEPTDEKYKQVEIQPDGVIVDVTIAS